MLELASLCSRGMVAGCWIRENCLDKRSGELEVGCGDYNNNSLYASSTRVSRYRDKVRPDQRGGLGKQRLGKERIGERIVL
jgi:hypothetical protein